MYYSSSSCWALTWSGSLKLVSISGAFSKPCTVNFSAGSARSARKRKARGVSPGVWSWDRLQPAERATALLVGSLGIHPKSQLDRHHPEPNRLSPASRAPHLLIGFSWGSRPRLYAFVRSAHSQDLNDWPAVRIVWSATFLSSTSDSKTNLSFWPVSLWRCEAGAVWIYRKLKITNYAGGN